MAMAGSSETNRYDGWAEYYDIIHEGLPGEAEFYVELAVRTGGKALELGVGTGRIAIPMAMTGVDVVGLDNSMAMLRECSGKLRAVGETKGRLTLFQADMAAFELDARFSFIAMAYRTFMHLLTQEDQRRCLAAVRRHLCDGGVFALNTWVPKLRQIMFLSGLPSASARNLAGKHRVPGTDITIEHYHAASYNDFDQTLDEEHFVTEVADDGSILRETSLPFARAWTSPREMRNLIALCGFRARGVYGDFSLAPLDEDSSEMVWILEKAG